MLIIWISQFPVVNIIWIYFFLSFFSQCCWKCVHLDVLKANSFFPLNFSVKTNLSRYYGKDLNDIIYDITQKNKQSVVTEQATGRGSKCWHCCTSGVWECSDISTVMLESSCGVNEEHHVNETRWVKQVLYIRRRAVRNQSASAKAPDLPFTVSPSARFCCIRRINNLWI